MKGRNTPLVRTMQLIIWIITVPLSTTLGVYLDEVCASHEQVQGQATIDNITETVHIYSQLECFAECMREQTCR